MLDCSISAEQMTVTDEGGFLSRYDVGDDFDEFSICIYFCSCSLQTHRPQTQSINQVSIYAGSIHEKYDCVEKTVTRPFVLLSEVKVQNSAFNFYHGRHCICGMCGMWATRREHE